LCCCSKFSKQLEIDKRAAMVDMEVPQPNFKGFNPVGDCRWESIIDTATEAVQCDEQLNMRMKSFVGFLLSAKELSVNTNFQKEPNPNAKAALAKFLASAQRVKQNVVPAELLKAAEQCTRISPPTASADNLAATGKAEVASKRSLRATGKNESSAKLQCAPFAAAPVSLLGVSLASNMPPVPPASGSPRTASWREAHQKPQRHQPPLPQASSSMRPPLGETRMNLDAPLAEVPMPRFLQPWGSHAVEPRDVRSKPLAFPRSEQFSGWDKWQEGAANSAQGRVPIGLMGDAVVIEHMSL